MKQFWIQVVALVIVALGAIILTFNTSFLTGLSSQGSSTSNISNAVSEVKIGNTLVNVEVADTQEKRQQGLSGRQQLATDSGMLFVFSSSGKHSFWMKDMQFPLDFIWILNNQVVDITQNVPNPPPDQPASSLPIYESNSNIDKMLEVNAGFVASHNIQVGDPVTLIGG